MTSNLESFHLITLNVNGLNDVRKRRLAFQYLKRFKKTIFLLQETHCRPGNGRLWKSQWGSTIFLTEESANTGGVAILFSKDLDPSINSIMPSKFNRFLIADFSLKGENYQVVSIYMPTANREKLQIEILEELHSLLQQDGGTSHIILGGDFNVSIDPLLDQKGYANDDIPNKKFRTELLEVLERFDLSDLWRIQNPKSNSHTWSRSGHFSRLDYFFSPNNFPGLLKTSDPKTVPFSDHRMVFLKIRPSPPPRGKGFWKFKTSLLQNEDFCKEVIVAIEVGAENAKDLSPQMRWEFIKLSIRESAMKFDKKRREEQNRLEAELETQLFTLEKDLYNSQEIQEENQVIKRELYQIQLARTRESMIRSKVKWVGEGERPTKYFLNLERKNFESKIVSALIDDSGATITDPGDILGLEKEFFTKLYTDQQNDDPEQNSVHREEFLKSNTSLSDMDRELLNRNISLEELEIALKGMLNGKAPGSDGLPPELYKRFWGILGPHLLASLLQAEDLGTLAPDQRRGIIALIPKKGKDNRYLQNWRPISMLNCDYKIMAKALAKRLSHFLPKLIHANQTGFIPTRYIGDNIRNIQALMDFTQETGREGLLVSLDFRAAFDSVNHQFLLQALESYNLGDKFISWISTLYSQAEACVLNSGQSSGWFPLRRGVRQGCPISPSLFVLAAEKL